MWWLAEQPAVFKSCPSQWEPDAFSRAQERIVWRILTTSLQSHWIWSVKSCYFGAYRYQKMSKITLSKFKKTTMLNQHFTVGDGEGPGPVSILSLHFMIKTCLYICQPCVSNHGSIFRARVSSYETGKLGQSSVSRFLALLLTRHSNTLLRCTVVRK